ncbi:MAG: hypothetical protein L0216_13875 [Planctomycetales bacterium]|nr:hypothetical protein [Planctomycetales bacterium]
MRDQRERPHVGDPDERDQEDEEREDTPERGERGKVPCLRDEEQVEEADRAEEELRGDDRRREPEGRREQRPPCRVEPDAFARGEKQRAKASG